MSNGPSRRGRPGQDPTLVRSQPALRTSSGAIWIIVASLFAAVSLVPLLGIIGRGGAPAGVAIATAVVLVALLAAMVAVRLTAQPGPPRLRVLAICFPRDGAGRTDRHDHVRPAGVGAARMSRGASR